MIIVILAAVAFGRAAGQKFPAPGAKQISPQLQNILRAEFRSKILLFAVQVVLYIVEQCFRNNRLMDAWHMTGRFVLIWPYNRSSHSKPGCAS